MLYIKNLLLLASFAAERAHASCAYGTHLHARAEGGVEVNTFGYTGSISPLNWLSLDPAANTACATGRNQSPIDMTTDQFTLMAAADVALNVPDIEETEIENLGTTVEVVVPEGANATMTANGTLFTMKQFHFHLPSEHLDAGRSFAMEMHMVFESADKKIAVLGNYLDTANGPNVAAAAKAGAASAAASAGAAAAAGAAEAAVPAVKRRHARDVTVASSAASQSILDKIVQLLGGNKAAAADVAKSTANTTAGAATGAAAGAATGAATFGAETGGSALINSIWASAAQVATPGTKAKIGPLAMSSLVDSIKAASLQAYSGSLTTPPCSEGVSWFVSTQKQTVSLSTFETARDIIGFNARFPQNKLGEQNLLSLAASANNGATAAAAAVAAAAVEGAKM